MIENRLGDYLEHMRQAASDALIFVEGLNKAEFAQDKRTQQAVIMSLVIIGEAATKVMDRSWLLRYQSGCSVGNGSGRFA